MRKNKHRRRSFYSRTDRQSCSHEQFLLVHHGWSAPQTICCSRWLRCAIQRTSCYPYRSTRNSLQGTLNPSSILIHGWDVIANLSSSPSIPHCTVHSFCTARILKQHRSFISCNYRLRIG